MQYFLTYIISEEGQSCDLSVRNTVSRPAELYSQIKVIDPKYFLTSSPSAKNIVMEEWEDLASKQRIH
uniref:Uncharacterized protein n=1 Tax=Ditylenchus dipsaci TaxID=166011 RepID=A0A915E5R6_9BILA